ncbi:unannotated protein [freshwater metagenome]|uniref:Unannotated protein n=1 Tax=freshwater metagenome TaxID=449393 RepID=A0A6J7J0V7_9ZZZZ
MTEHRKPNAASAAVLLDSTIHGGNDASRRNTAAPGEPGLVCDAPTVPLRDDMFVPPVNPLPPLDGLQLHMVGIRGRGLRPLAIVARHLGAQIDGCDLYGDIAHPELVAAGITVGAGHAVEHVGGRHVVTSSAVPRELPEVAAALAAGRLHHRADLLAAVMAARVSVGVTGSHGKGTVAALIAAALFQHGDDPLAIIGAPVRNFGGSVQLGSGPLVAEVDDSDGSLSRISADVGVLTNSWFDHPIFGRSLTENRRDISVFLENTPIDGHVILGRQKELRPMARRAQATVLVLGRDFEGRTHSVSRSGEVVEVTDLDGSCFDIEVNILAGNLADDVAMAFMALRSIGLSGEQAAVALSALTGISRRVEFVGEAAGVCVYDDLGKHPESLSAVIREIRKRTSGRLHVVFEPFLHADLLRWRTRWIEVLAQADSVIVLPVELRQSFPVPRRAPLDWAAALAERLINAETRLEAADVVSQIARSGDSVLIAGCVDDLDEVAPWVLERL